MTKLAAKKNDIIFFDPATGEKVCSFNECRHKFTIQSSHTVVNNPVVGMTDDKKYVRMEVESQSHFHQCSECGRKIANRTDRQKSINNYFDSKQKTARRRSYS